MATAAVTGLVGFGAAWLQGRTSIRSAQEETQRVRLQHREEHLRNRQGTYHEMLKALRDLDALMSGGLPGDEARLFDCLDRYRYYPAGIDLFGTRRVRDAIDVVAEEMPLLPKEEPRFEGRMSGSSWNFDGDPRG